MKPITGGAMGDPAAYILSARVLDHARRQQWDEATALLARIGAMGSRAQLTLVYGMADTIAQVHEWAVGPAPDGAVISPLWHYPETGETSDDADQVNPPARWVGRFIVARAANDRATCEALLDTFDDDEDWSDAVSMLVTTAALTINCLLGEPR